MAGENETIQDLVNELNTEGEEEKSELEVKSPKEEGEETEKEGEENEEGEIEKEEKGAKELEDRTPAFKEITKKYPTLFKDFPNLRHMFFHEREYRELFPTVDDARDAVEELEGLRELEQSLAKGDPEDIAGIIDSFKELGEDTVTKFAVNFLPALRKVDQDVYYQTITPELVSFVRTMFDTGARNSNENLQNAALVASLHFFGDPKVASGEKEIKMPEVNKKKDDKLEDERANFRHERYSAFYNDVVQDSDNKLVRMISDGIDPKEVMTDKLKELVVEKTIKEITKTLSTDKSHMSRINSLWRKAAEANFSSAWKSKIISTYLESAKEIMPRIRSSIKSGVLGTRERHSEIDGQEEQKETGKPKSNNVSRPSGNGKNDKNIDWRKTTDLDYIKGKITYKS